MNGKISSSKQKAKIAILLMWSLLFIFPALIISGYYLENLHEINAKALLALLVTLISFVIVIASLVVFIIWFYKAYSNLYQKTSNLKYKKYWAILGWIIPIINLYLPYFLIKDMYSNIAILTNDSTAVENFKKLTAINIWWALYILGWILDIGYYIAIYPDKSIVFDITTYILLIPSVWFTVKIIRDYCESEERLFSN
ncbi:MAG: DUF4328 domain-containing protein [Campylobacteraceae bacterium]|jgi:heme/copper-type cytochrome/quinol oxidase subunit 2|nr:DUF4328 domain-containing protein [Campylobacteraceae bacterium]